MKKKLLAIVFGLLYFNCGWGQGLAYNETTLPASQFQPINYSLVGKKYPHPYHHTGTYVPGCMIIGGLALAVVGGGLMLSNQDGNSQAFQNGQALLAAGGVSFVIGGFISVIQYAAGHSRRYTMISSARYGEGIAYNFK